MGQIKCDYVVITTPIEELEIDIAVGKVHSVDATNLTDTNDYNDSKYDPSGIVLISLIKCQRNTHGVI